MLLKSAMVAEEGLALSAAVKLVCPRERRALLLRQADGRWDLPGGHLEEGEGLEDALAREVREELGLPLPSVRLLGEWLYVRPQRRARLVTFYALMNEAAFDLPDLCLSDEHCEAAWIGIGEVDRLDMPQGYRDAVRTVLSAVD
ncbi:MAG TPA: NUDIX hydrolase [Pedomonas sp.]|uniref:NUDIX hydrolase n=1 Tax=Pedomonas sp. TaxID=2976421 RepID=UPI002F4067DD